MAAMPFPCYGILVFVGDLPRIFPISTSSSLKLKMTSWPSPTRKPGYMSSYLQPTSWAATNSEPSTCATNLEFSTGTSATPVWEHYTIRSLRRRKRSVSIIWNHSPNGSTRFGKISLYSTSRKPSPCRSPVKTEMDRKLRWRNTSAEDLNGLNYHRAAPPVSAITSYTPTWR